MKKLTVEERKMVQGGMPVWACYDSGHKWQMMIYGSDQLTSHFKRWLSHNPVFIRYQ